MADVQKFYAKQGVCWGTRTESEKEAAPKRVRFFLISNPT